MTIKTIHTTDEHFDEQFAALLAGTSTIDNETIAIVDEIIAAVKQRGDDALLAYSRRFDRLSISSITECEIPAERWQQALQALDDKPREALMAAAKRIRDYHEHQRQQSWSYTEDDGTVLGQRIQAIERVGIYVPGGKACYPSSVLMNAIPAHIAGVAEIIMVVPAPSGHIEPTVLAAAALAGVTRLFTIGGAQAIAALAFGTPTIPRVDKIVGPGNRYVAAAKRQVFGLVGLDMIAGPSEIAIVCDGHTDADWIAMDLFSQAEHDETAQALLFSPDEVFLQRVAASIDRLLPTLERRAIIEQSLRKRGALIHVADLAQAAELVNRIAPEHLELSVADPDALLPHIRHAGAIFMGRYSAEALGDYCAGPNHVLPTAGTARFSSPLGVYDFQKRSSIIHCSARGARQWAEVTATLARCEGLTAHARSAEYRR